MSLVPITALGTLPERVALNEVGITSAVVTSFIV